MQTQHALALIAQLWLETGDSYRTPLNLILGVLVHGSFQLVDAVGSKGYFGLVLTAGSFHTRAVSQ